MSRVWAVSLGEKERIELERVVMDDDRDGALDFLKNVVYAAVKDIEKPQSCYHKVEKPVEDLGRPIKKHKNLGSFD